MADESILRVEVVTPDGQVYGDAAEMVVVAGVEGELGIMKGHQPLVSLLAIGDTRVHRNDATIDHIATGIGYVEVLFDRVLVVVDHAEPAAKIDRSRALKAQSRAEEWLRLRNEASARDDVDFARAEQALKRAVNRLHVAERG